MLRRLVAGLLLFSLGCSGGAPPIKEEPKQDKAAEKDASSCDLSYATLDGKTFVRSTSSDAKGEQDMLARVRFNKEGDKLKARYTTRALTDVYVYTCSEQKDEISCWQDDVKVEYFCRALVANEKECTPEAVAQLTGLKADAIKAKVDETKAEIKKTTGKPLHDLKALYSSAAKPLRGTIHIRVKKKDCTLSFADMFQYMSAGQLKEVENVTGTSIFVKTEKDLVFEHCTDGQNLVILKAPDAPGKPGDSVKEAAPGQALPVRYVGSEHSKPEGDCTYTMDTWVGYQSMQRDAAVKPGDGGKLDWSFTATFSKAEALPQVVHMYRYRTCGGKPKESLGVSCQSVRVK